MQGAALRRSEPGLPRGDRPGAEQRLAFYGLVEAERAQGHRLEAAAARQAFERAWAGNKRWLRMERL